MIFFLPVTAMRVLCLFGFSVRFQLWNGVNAASLPPIPSLASSGSVGEMLGMFNQTSLLSVGNASLSLQ